MSTDKPDNLSKRPQDPHEESFSQWFHSWRYLFWLVGLVGLTVLLYAEEDWRGQRAWRMYKEKMTARGESFEPSAFIPPPVPDDENFAMTAALSPLFGFIPGSQRWSNPKAPRLFESLSARYDAASKLVKPAAPAVLNSWVRQRADLGLWAAAFAAGTNHPEPITLQVRSSSSKDAAA